MNDTSRLFNHKLHLTLNSLQLARSKDLLKILIKGNEEDKLKGFLKELESLLKKFQEDVDGVDRLLTDTINIVCVLRQKSNVSGPQFRLHSRSPFIHSSK